MGVFSDTGRFLRETVQGAGRAVEVMLRTFAQLHAAPRRGRAILDQMYIAGVKALPVTLLVAVFAGMILALQTGIELRKFGSEEFIGRVVAASMCREMGPFVTGIILAATVGSAMAAEVGTMNVSEEITALEVMSVDPVRYIVLPRVVGLTVMCPLLTIFANLVGILGGAVVGDIHLGISFASYMGSVQESLLSPGELLPKDIYAGLVKALVFGLTISCVGCASGLAATEGALGVGQAVQRAVRNSILLIIVLGYLVTWFFYFFLPS